MLKQIVLEEGENARCNLQPLWSEDNYSKNDSISNIFEGIEIDGGFLCRN